MGWRNKDTVKKILAVLIVVILAGITAQALYIGTFNQTVHTAAGADDAQEAYLDLHARGDATSTWMKRDFDLDGKKVDLEATTLDGTLYNRSGDLLSTWTMRINIGSDCFINNAWCGTVEIHQFVGTDAEAVQTLDLRDYDIESVKLSHLYDGDLMIPLQKGDYLVYYPSGKDGELDIAPQGELTMGMIFYYIDPLDLSDYSIDYYYHRDFTYGVGFIALIVLAVLWVFLLVGMKVADLTYKRAVKDNELRNSGLASMSSIYAIISYIDLEKDELIPVYTTDTLKGKLPQGPGAREQILDIFGRDTVESYRDIVLEFVDTETLPQRLDRESIACEYVSKGYGWAQIRFFADNREEGQPLKRVLFTIEDINDEKRELAQFVERANQAELESRARNAFVAGVSSSMRPPIKTILELDEKILAESGDEPVRAYARRIKSEGRMLSYMIDGAVDSALLVSGGMKLAAEEYSFKEMADEVCDIVRTIAEDDALSLETDIAASVPDRLVGDAPRIERLLAHLLTYATRHAHSEAVKLSVFGKAAGRSAHILFSVKMTGDGLADEEMRDLSEFISDIEEGESSAVARDQGIETVAVLLAFMDSKLQVINEPGKGCEFYFEIEQEVAGAPSDEGADEDEGE